VIAKGNSYDVIVTHTVLIEGMLMKARVLEEEAIHARELLSWCVTSFGAQQ
jgi:hypothetical protein